MDWNSKNNRKNCHKLKLSKTILSIFNRLILVQNYFKPNKLISRKFPIIFFVELNFFDKTDQKMRVLDFPESIYNILNRILSWKSWFRKKCRWIIFLELSLFWRKWQKKIFFDVFLEFIQSCSKRILYRKFDFKKILVKFVGT